LAQWPFITLANNTAGQQKLKNGITMLQHSRSLLLTLFGILLLATKAFAEDNYVKTFDDYEVHYSVFNTSFLTPQVAQGYNIVRSGSRALMNIAVLKKQPDGSMKNVTAIVTGEQYDLVRHDPLEFKEVREEHAIYYLSSFEFQNRATLYFTVMIQPDPNQPAYKLEFNKMLYRDE
jgi:hypothetical protein